MLLEQMVQKRRRQEFDRVKEPIVGFSGYTFPAGVREAARIKAGSVIGALELFECFNNLVDAVEILHGQNLR